MGIMAKLDNTTARVRAADPRCDHAVQVPRHSDGSGLFYVCTGCGAYIDYLREKRESVGNLDAA